MYAVFQHKDKQYKVSKGQIICVDKLDYIEGDIINFNKIMLFSDGSDIRIGTPFITGIEILAEVISHDRTNKISIIKFNRRKHFRKHYNHRQWFTRLKILNFNCC